MNTHSSGNICPCLITIASKRMSKGILYISYFDFQDSPIRRDYVTSATNKMESICASLNAAGYKVNIISIAPVIEPRFKFYRGRTIRRNENLTLKLFASWGGNSRILRQLKTIWHLFALFFYLLLHTSNGQPVMVYHSLGYFNVILWAKKIKRFKLILEVEEIYQDVGAPKFRSMARYENLMIKAADAYIFPTELLNAKLNTAGKPHVIIYGTYTVEPQIVDKFSDGKIHVVYAGTFDSRKGGALAAIEATEFLPENYHMHICGFGTAKDTADVKDQIASMTAKSRASISFDGLKKGMDYIKFIQRCHIGLSTQDPSAAFNATSFPSKILSYMANGLSVVTIDIPVIRMASIGKYVSFYEKQNPQDIAESIKMTQIDNSNRVILTDLFRQFCVRISSMLKGFHNPFNHIDNNYNTN